MPVKHPFTSGKADGGDATKVRPSNWNADHTAPELESAVEASITGATTADFSAKSTYEYLLTGNVTFTFTNPTGRGWVALRLKQDTTGGRTVAWPASVRWSGGTAPTLTATASKTDYISFYWNGTNYDGFVNLNY